MIRRSESYFKGFQDLELFYQVWTPEKPRGTLVVTHGLGEHSECYQLLAQGLSHTDWEIFCWDLRGHGRSEGRRGVIKSFSDYTQDLHIFVKHLQQLKPRRPMALLGHSMGGLVTTRTLMEFDDLGVKALALSSPLFGIAVQAPKIKQMAAQFLNKYLPDLTLYNEILYSDLTNDANVISEYQRDPLRHDRISSRLYMELMAAMEKCMSQASKIWLPLLIQQAGEDKIVSRSATEMFFDKAGSGTKKLKIYENFYHEIFNEVGRKEVFADLSSWLDPYLNV